MTYIKSENSKVILITGASRGIGSALAVAAAAEGHNVVVNYRSESIEIQQLISDINGRAGSAIGIRADVGLPEDVQRLIDETRAHFGRIDCVINNAGLGEVCPIDRLDLAFFKRRFMQI